MGEPKGEHGKAPETFEEAVVRFESLLYMLRDVVDRNDISGIRQISLELSSIAGRYPELEPDRDLVTQFDH